MPVIRKRGHQYSPSEKIPKSKKPNESYNFMDNIGYKEDHFHVLYKNVPPSIEDASEHVAKNVVSLLNAGGGILTYGVQSNGRIYGERISRCEQDKLTHSSIDGAIRRIIPIVEGDMYSIIFNDVVGAPLDGQTHNRKVVRIKVTPGRPYELYEDLNHHVYQRRESSIYGPYTPHDIKDHTIKQMKEVIRSNEKLVDVLDTPPPRKPVVKSSVVSSHPSKHAPGVKSGLEKTKQGHSEGQRNSDKREGSSDKTEGHSSKKEGNSDSGLKSKKGESSDKGHTSSDGREGSSDNKQSHSSVPRDKENKVPKSIAATSVSNKAPPPSKLATALSNKPQPTAVPVTRPPPANQIRACSSKTIKLNTTSAPPVNNAATRVPSNTARNWISLLPPPPPPSYMVNRLPPPPPPSYMVNRRIAYPPYCPITAPEAPPPVHPTYRVHQYTAQRYYGRHY